MFELLHIKYKPFNNVFLIAATFLDPWTKDFEFSRNLCDTKPYELIEKAKHFLIKRDKEINPHTTKKNSNEKKNILFGKRIRWIQSKMNLIRFAVEPKT